MLTKIGIEMTNPTNSESQIHYGGTNISIKNINTIVSIINECYCEHIAYYTNLNGVNNGYGCRIINSNSLLLELIVFITIHQYLLKQFDEFYLQLFQSFILNDNQYYYMETYYILYTNNDPYAINNKENFLILFMNRLYLKVILYCLWNKENEQVNHYIVLPEIFVDNN